MRPFTPLACALFACVLAPPLFGQADSPQDDQGTVQGFIDRVELLRKRPGFQPAESKIIHGRKLWFVRTLDRLDEFIVDAPQSDVWLDVSNWPEQLRLTDIRTELARDEPSGKELLDIFSGDKYDSLREKIGADSGRDRLVDTDQAGYLIVRSMLRAFERYAIALAEAQNPTLGKQNLSCHLTVLQQALVDYQSDEDDSSRREAIRAIHEVLRKLTYSNQHLELVKDIRRAYLHPQARVYVSTKMLNHLINFVPLEPISQSQAQGGTFIQGTATPLGRVRIVAVTDHRRAVFEAIYDDAVVFEGTASRKRICLGIQACIGSQFEKRFILRHGLPDSLPAQLNMRLVSTDTSGGGLIDALVDSVARKNFQGDAIADELEDAIDDRITRVANYVRTDIIQKSLDQLVEDRIVHERVYRSVPGGLEMTLLSARDGFTESDNSPIPAPPDFFLDDFAQVDFAISLRQGFLGEVLSGRFPSAERKLSTAAVAGRIQQLFRLVGDDVWGDDAPRIGFPDDPEDVLRIDGNRLTIQFVIDSKKENVTEVPVTLSIEYRRTEGGFDLTPTVSVADDPETQARIEQLLRPLAKLTRIELPKVSIRGKAVSPGALVNIDFDQTGGFFTIMGSLDEE